MIRAVKFLPRRANVTFGADDVEKTYEEMKQRRRTATALAVAARNA